MALHPTLSDPTLVLPTDGLSGTLVGRIWNAHVQGPSPVVLRDGNVFDISESFATMSALTETEDCASVVSELQGSYVGTLDEILINSLAENQSDENSHFLSPIDLQVVKAAGVTFAVSMIERVIEERARGNAAEAARVRELVVEKIGNEFSSLKPGSQAATDLKALLLEEELWSQYLEVGIGPDAEIFTKSPTLATVGFGAQIGIYSKSTWNNPEPEVVLVVRSDGKIVGATLGNDVNLRDFEGRSALLLSKAKDNNASGSLGPFIRLLDKSFTLDDVRTMKVNLTVTGLDGFVLEDGSDMSKISRDPEELVRQLIGSHHQYPDGAVLFLGTLFAPTKDRDEAGHGFTHKPGDTVQINSPLLGTLVNEVQTSESCPPWTFGIGDLIRNLGRRGLL